jgi:membrane-associated protease RseP (regulator of RpoE activity)
MRTAMRLGAVLAVLLFAAAAAVAQGVEDDLSVMNPDTAEQEFSVPEYGIMPGFHRMYRGDYGDLERRYADAQGVLVADVYVDSPAEKAGIIRGDIITAVDGVATSSPAEIAGALEGYEYGDTVEITLLRGGEEMTLSLKLETRIGRPLVGIVGGGYREGPFSGSAPMRRDYEYRNAEPRGKGWGPPQEESEELQDNGENGFAERFFGQGLSRMLPEGISEDMLESVLSGQSAYVTEVAPGSPAAEAGLEAQLLIVAVNGEELEDGDLASRIRSMEPGSEVTLTTLSMNGTEEVTVILGDNDGNAFLGVTYYPFGMGGPGAGNLFPYQDESLRNNRTMPGGPQLRLPDSRNN